MSKYIIQFNEANFDLIKKYSIEYDLPGFRKIINMPSFFETVSEKEYKNLEPWIQWYSFYTELPFDKHKVFHLGDCTKNNHESFISKIINNNKKVGVFGAMNHKFEKNAKIFIPDAWTKTDCDKSISSRFVSSAISSIVNNNARMKITVKDFIGVFFLIFRPFKFKNIIMSLLSFFKRSRDELAAHFDIFFLNYSFFRAKKSKLDFSIIFLNGLAHTQHHYLLSSKYIEGSNPEWYANPKKDPILECIKIYDKGFNSISDTDTLDLDPRSFSRNFEIFETDISNSGSDISIEQSKDLKDKSSFLKNKLNEYLISENFENPFTFTHEINDQFLLVSVKNILVDQKKVGYIAVIEESNDIKFAFIERKNFVLRTAAIIALVILIFSFVLNRYFLKPIKNLVHYTEIIKDKSKEDTNIDIYKNRKDELGTLSKSMDEMTNELQRRINNAENFSRDLVHEIRNPLASLKSASEIISETDSKEQKSKLIKIVSHDVERIERLITDYSQMLKDEAAISSEKMIILNLKNILTSVVDDFNNIYNTKRGISVKLSANGSGNYKILGIENRIEQIIANLLDNSVSFSDDNKKINILLNSDSDGYVKVNVIDEGRGFKELDTKKIFKRFYSNRPDKFGEHSGLGLNIVKNLVELHNGTIIAKNNKDKGANVEIIFPSADSKVD